MPRGHKRNDLVDFNEVFKDYVSTFVQRIPRYAVKHPKGQGWKSKSKALTDRAIHAHLDQKYSVGVLGRWYPEFAILDIDEAPLERVNEIRDDLGLDERNSMLCSSESPDSYHLLIKPQYNGRPPTIKLLQDIFRGFGGQYGIEIYPKPKKTIRLPFGAYQKCLDFDYLNLTSWEDRLYWFQKLDEFDLSAVPRHQMELSFDSPIHEVRLPSVFKEGAELLEYGLNRPSSRYEAQFKVIYHLWRLNLPFDEAVRIVWSWIKKKHNGFSRDIVRNPSQVKKEISRQVAWVYGHYQRYQIYPDSTHNNHNGFITEPDVRDIIEICRASMPRMRFLFNLIKYSYPRRHRPFINVHRDRLVQWANERTYLKRLNELDEKGIISRGRAYLTGKFSKSLRPNWKFRDSREAVLYEGRALNTLEDTLRLLYKPDELRSLLKRSGIESYNISKIVRKVYGLGQIAKVQHINN